jgi:HEAT repeat protein
MKQLRLYLLLLVLLPAVAAAGKLSTDDLIKNLQSGDAGQRAEAAKELGDRTESLGTPALVAATKDKDSKVQMAVVQAIGKIKNLDQMHALCEAVRNTGGDAQREAIQLLNQRYLPKQKGYADDAMLKLERPTDWYPMVDSEAVDALLFVLDDQKSVNRIQAAATLGMIKAERALPRLDYFLKSPNEKMARICVRAVGNIGRKDEGAGLIPLLKHPNNDIVVDTVRVLGYFHYKPALPELQHFLDYSNKKEYKRVALQAISRIADPSSEATMKKYSNDEDTLLRQYAIEGFGRIGLTQYTDGLEREFLREKNKQLKLALSFTLFKLGRKAYLDNLVRAMDDEPYEDLVRGYFVELGDSAIAPLAGYLKPSNKKFKIQLMQMLSDVGSETAIPFLEPYLKDQDVDIAQAATDAIRELKRPRTNSEG